MAISIDRVYQKVLAFANKEQRGYITPQEFNLFAHQAQMEIFEQYFYDTNQWIRQHGNSIGYSDMIENLQEKISRFESYATGDNVTVLNKWGDVNLENDLPNLYRMGRVRVKYPENRGYVEAEVCHDPRERDLLDSSKLTRRSVKRPIYLRYKNNYDRIKIYPYPVEDDGSNFDLSTTELEIGTNQFVEVLGNTNPGADVGLVNGGYFYFNVEDMNALIGDSDDYISGDIINVSVTRTENNTVVYSNVEVVLFDGDAGNSDDGYGHGRRNPWGEAAAADWQVGDKIFLANALPPTANNKRNVRVDYIKKPLTPNWGYMVVNDKALYNGSESTDFELHDSEESELVYRILAYAGVAIEKPNLTQMAIGLEQAKVQQEKQ